MSRKLTDNIITREEARAINRKVMFLERFKLRAISNELKTNPFSMSANEADYWAHLIRHLVVGEYRHIATRGISVRLENGEQVTPAFTVTTRSGHIELHCLDIPKEKVRMAAQQWPQFRWEMIIVKNGEWVKGGIF